MNPKLTLGKLADGWYIYGLEFTDTDTGEACCKIGPYKTKQEAASDARGMQRVLRDEEYK